MGESSATSLQAPDWQRPVGFGRLLRRTLGSNWNPLTITGAGLVAILVLIGIAGPLVVSNPNSIAAPAFLSPSWHEPFGTDAYGRSILARVVVGTRTSLFIA